MPLARLSSGYTLLSMAKLNGNFILPGNTANHRRAFSGTPWSPPPNTLFPKQWSHMEAHLCCPGVCHFFVQTDVQVVAWLVGQEETNGNCLPGWCQPDVDLQLGLEDAEFPQATPVAHHHAPHRFFNLKTHKENVPHFQDTSTTSVPPPSCCSTGHTATGGAPEQRRSKLQATARVPGCSWTPVARPFSP